jgi:hypothetical protein
MSQIDSSYSSLSELRDLIIHMERYSAGVAGGLYHPCDKEFQELAQQLFGLAAQLKDFSRQKAHLALPRTMY